MVHGSSPCGPTTFKSRALRGFCVSGGTRQIQSYGPKVRAFTAQLPDNSREPTFSTESAKNCRSDSSSILRRRWRRGKLLHLCASTIATGAAAGGAMFSLVGSAGVFVETAILMLCWPRCWLRCVSGCLLFMAVPGPGQRCIVDKMPRGAAAATHTQIWKAVEQGVLS